MGGLSNVVSNLLGYRWGCKDQTLGVTLVFQPSKKNDVSKWGCQSMGINGDVMSS